MPVDFRYTPRKLCLCLGVGDTVFTLAVRVSVHPSVVHFRMTTWVNINGFSPNLVFALILLKSGLGMLTDKFRQFLTELGCHMIVAGIMVSRFYLWVQWFCLPFAFNNNLATAELFLVRDTYCHFTVNLTSSSNINRDNFTHYENTPIQIYRKFHLQKLKNFR